MPALATTMSIPPKRSAAAAASASSAAGSRTSVDSPIVSGRPRSSPLREPSASAAPSALSRRATAAPMPRLAPVMSATRP